MENIGLILPALVYLFAFMVTTVVVWVLLHRWRQNDKQEVERIYRQLERVYSLVKSLSEVSGSSQSREDIQALEGQIEKLSSAVTILVGLNQRMGDSVPENGGRFKLAQKLLQNGDSPVKIAQQLNMGLAEIDLLSRLMQTQVNSKTS